MDTSYLLINAWPPNTLLANFPGRKCVRVPCAASCYTSAGIPCVTQVSVTKAVRRYLLDMGSSTFDTSLDFFTTRYEQVRCHTAQCANTMAVLALSRH